MLVSGSLRDRDGNRDRHGSACARLRLGFGLGLGLGVGLALGFRLDFEIAAILYRRSGNQWLADAFERDCADSRAVAPSRWSDLPLGRRLGEASARLLSPLL